MKVVLPFFAFVFLCFNGMSQKIRFASSIGTSYFVWHENQTTVDLGAQLTFKLPQKRYQIYAKLKTLGNVHNSLVDRSQYKFVEPPLSSKNKPLGPNEALYANYRGGQAQLGILWQFSSGLQPIVELYSKSIARKITSDRSQYIEEEKYALHGISLGLQYATQMKQSKLLLHTKVFEPLYHDITLYGKYVGVPYSTLTTSNSISYQTGLEYQVKKFGLTLQYELLNIGAASNTNSKTIPASEAKLFSTLLTYHF